MAGACSLLKTFDNRGEVVVNSGTLVLGAMGEHTGKFTVALGKKLVFIDGNHTGTEQFALQGDGIYVANAGGGLTVNTAGAVTVKNFELGAGGILAGTANFSADFFNWTGGKQEGTGTTEVKSGKL